MRDRQGFDLWAAAYDEAVAQCEKENTYPFAGYTRILKCICRYVPENGQPDVLDIGVGTGRLAQMLYDRGCRIWGQDFSEQMLAKAHARMPRARLYLGDFSCGLHKSLRTRRYDAITATYALHHLPDERKRRFIKSLVTLLKPDGVILIGDVAFETRAQMDEYARSVGDRWDGDEYYFVIEELKAVFPERIVFEKMSPCSGVIVFR